MVQMQQLSLLTESRNIIAAAGAISVLKASMRSVADSSPYSRDQIADCMTAISLASGKRLTAGRAKSTCDAASPTSSANARLKT